MLNSELHNALIAVVADPLCSHGLDLSPEHIGVPLQSGFTSRGAREHVEEPHSGRFVQLRSDRRQDVHEELRWIHVDIRNALQISLDQHALVQIQVRYVGLALPADLSGSFPPDGESPQMLQLFLRELPHVEVRRAHVVSLPPQHGEVVVLVLHGLGHHRRLLTHRGFRGRDEDD